MLNKFRITFSYDSNSNILSNGTNGYSYDALDRLTSVDRGDSLTGNENMRMLDRNKQEKLSIDYNYDSLGNRDSIEQTLSWTTKKGQEKEKTRIADYTNNALNQYTSVALSKTKSDDDEKNRNPKFIYDRNGNMVDDGKQKYSYDYRNRLVKVESYETKKKEKTSTNLVAEFGEYDILI